MRRWPVACGAGNCIALDGRRGAILKDAVPRWRVGCILSAGLQMYRYWSWVLDEVMECTRQVSWRATRRARCAAIGCQLCVQPWCRQQAQHRIECAANYSLQPTLASEMTQCIANVAIELRIKVSCYQQKAAAFRAAKLWLTGMQALPRSKLDLGRRKVCIQSYPYNAAHRTAIQHSEVLSLGTSPYTAAIPRA